MNEEMLKEQAKQIRRDIVNMVGAAKSGHPGGSLSAAEILTYLYFDEMNVKPEEPKWADLKVMQHLCCMQHWHTEAFSQ